MKLKENLIEINFQPLKTQKFRVPCPRGQPVTSQTITMDNEPRKPCKF
jgi:hypothetical protein